MQDIFSAVNIKQKIRDVSDNSGIAGKASGNSTRLIERKNIKLAPFCGIMFCFYPALKVNCPAVSDMCYILGIF